MKPSKTTKAHLWFLLLSVFWSSTITAQPCGALNNFSSGITIGPSQAPNIWYPDRYPPSGFSSPSNDIAGGTSLKESISTADAAVNRPTGQLQGSFYNTQGRQLDLINGVQSIEIKLYVPSAWSSSNKRMAGFWGVALNAGNAVTNYPIVEFTSATDVDGNGGRFRVWEDGSSTWVHFGLPTGFAYDSWVTIRMAMSTSNPGQFVYTLGDLSYTTTTNSPSSVRIGSAILEGYNYDPTQPLDATNPGVNYAIYWDDFVQSTKNDGLDHLTIKNANTNYYYCTIQSAINDATTLTGHTIEVASGNYSEQVIVNKGVKILGTGAAKPIINFTGTVSGKPTLFDISAASVTLENLKLNVDLVKLSSAIIATGTNIDNLTIKNDSINPIGSSATGSFGSYSDRNAVSINYASYRAATSGVNNISFLNNVITGVANDGFGVARYFRSGVGADEAGGTFDGNTIQSINQDIQVRFGSNGDINFTNNKINGGGAEVSSSNIGAGNINVSGNTFDGTFANTFSSSLRLKTNSNSKTTTVSGNVFKNHIWGISLESYNAVTVDNNTFTPLANSTNYRHITENTKEISSTSGYFQPIVGGTFTNNTFNGSGTTGGVALVFYNHDNDNPIFQTFTIGTAGNENNFNTGIATFIKLDNTTGPTGTGTSPNIVAATGFPEYGGNIAITTMACWSINLDIVNNKFDVGAGLQLPAAMSITQRAALEPVLFHKPDAACTGILAYYYPVHNITSGTKFPTIQSAIDAASANDSIFVEAGIFTEQLNINKSLNFSGAGAGMCGTGSRPTNETHLIAPNSGNLLNLSGAITVNFDGFEVDSANVANITVPNQNLALRNSVFNLNFKPSSTNIFFGSNTLTLECNAFKAISGTNDGSASHIFFLGNALVADNNSFTSASAISSLNATTSSLPVWINLTLGANNANINHNSFSKVDIGILVANNAGNITIKENEFSEAKRESYPFGDGIGAGIALFGNLTPIGPIYIINNKFYNSEDGIRTSSNGTAFPAPSLLKIAYNSFENLSEKAIALGASYAGSTNKLNAICNWYGSITGPVIGTNVGATSGMQIVDGGSKVMYKNWLNYGTDADATQMGFQLPTTINVTPGNNTSQAENQYRVLSNAIGCAVEGQTIALSGTFDFNNSIAQAQWALGNNGVADNVGTVTGAGGDDYTITAPDSANNITLTATSLGAATILGPGDLPNVSLETPLFLDSRTASSSHRKWTISNLIFNNFDVGIIADNNGGPINVMDSLNISNNQFYIPADLNATVAPADNFQNIGINLNFGKGQTVTNNTFYVDGTGVSDVANSNYSKSMVLQSTTSGGNVYDGLKITNNSIHVTGVPNASPARIVGLWENSNNQTSAIELSGNTFVNDDPGNLAANNNQLAFRVTSFSGDATHQVVYKNNEVTGFNRGISFLGDPFSTYTPNTYAASENPVVIINNKFDKYNVAVSIIKDPSSPNTGSPAIVNDNSFTHVISGGFAISNQSSGTTAATCNWYDTLLVANILNGSVTYLPRLSNGTDASVATGFQVDPSNTCVSPVLNVNTGNTYVTIQAAVDAASANDSIFVTEGIYPENVVVNKPLKITGKDSALVILDKGDANYLNDITNIGFTITANNVSLKKMKVRNYGIAVRAMGVNTISLDSMSLIENYNYGFFTNQSLDSLVIKNSTLSFNGNKAGVRNGFSARGIFTQSTSADFSRFNIHDNLVERNGLTGIDINGSHSNSGLTIQNNISRYNFDEQIGVWLGNTNETTMGAILIKGNTLTLTDSAHYGMEVRMPHGTGLESGNGSVLIQGNTVGIINPINSVKDKAAIAIIRRKDGSDATTVANDQPEGVVIKDNVISDFQNGSSSGSAFGIVVGGIAHKIFNNTISNTQISIQLQKGNDNYNNNNDASSPYVPNNEYFDRDNSSDACAEIGTNTITGSSAPRIVTGPSTTGTTPVQYVTNLSTTVKFCTIQTAIDYPTTVSGNTIDAAANTYMENVIVSKPLTVQGPNQTINPNTGTRTTEAIVVPAVNNITDGRVFNVTANNVTIKGFTIDGDNTTINGGTPLNGADINAATGIGTGLYASIDGSSSLLVENNILQNFDNNNSNTGAIYGNGSQSVAITGNIFRNNQINNSNIWGILTESNYYASIQNNVITTANRGIQIDGFFIPAASPTPIAGNTVSYYKRGITVNNNFGTASQFTVSGNTIAPQTTGTNEDGGTGAVATNRGITVWSMYSGTGGTALADNKITGAGYGMELWNIAPGKLTSTGDSVLTSTNIGILIPTQSTYGSAAYGSFATITQATVIGSVNNGIQVSDSDGVSNTPAQLNLTNSFVTGGIKNIAIAGLEIDPTTTINNNSLTSASAKSIDASSYTGNPAINATCNWYGASSGGFISSRILGNVTYVPALTSGTDGDLVTKGFQPTATCAAPGKILYVNDGVSDGSDIYTTAVGNDANFGTPASPFRTIGYAASVAQAGDTIYVDAGRYIENDTINKPVTIYGTNKGTNGSGTRIAESIIQSNGNKNAIFTLAANNVKLDGLTMDGYDPTTTPGLLLSSGDFTNASYGIVTKTGSTVIKDTISNNIIKRVSIGFRGDNLSTGNLISSNWFDAIGRYDFGYGISLRSNFYADVINNKMTHVWTGLHTNAHNGAGGPATWTMSGNEIHSYAAGLCYWLNFNTATGLNINHNQFYEEGAAAPGTWSSDPTTSASVVPNNFGILVASLQDAVNAAVTNNKITGTDYGVGLTNIPTTNTLTLVATDTITNTNQSAVLLSNKLVNPVGTTVFGIGSASIINVAGAIISPSAGNGIEINATGGTTTTLNISAPTTITGGATGLRLNSGASAITGNTINNLSFVGQTSKYIVLDSSALTHITIDATATTFDGALGSAMLLPTLYATEDKINHKIDADSLGFVLVKANSAYVTPVSFIAPTTTTPKIQRGVNASSNGFTVNVKAGTYAENLIVNKSLTVLGAQTGQSANTRFAAFNTLKADPTVETIITAPTNNPSNGNPYANDLVRVFANNVTVDGFTLDGNNPALGTSTVTDNNSLPIHARRALTNIDTVDNFNPVSSLTVSNNIIQNLADRSISLANNGPVSTGNSISSNVIRNYGWGPNGGMAVILFTNAYADVTNNTISVPDDQIGLHLQNFFSNGTMTWSGNNITMGQYALGIHANNFYATSGVLNINNNTVNMASGITSTPEDLTWGINVWSIESGSTVHINNNTIGSSGGIFDRGINLWNMPTSNTVTVTGGTVANSVVGINLDNIDPYYGGASTTIANVTGTNITGSASAVRTRAALLATAPYYAANTVTGSVSLMLNNATINTTGTTKGVEVNSPAASAPNMATVYLTNGTAINNTTTSDTAVLVNGNQAQLYAASSYIKMGGGAHDGIQFANITSSNAVSNLVLAGGTTINRNGNTTAKAFSSPQYSIVEMYGTGWTAPDSTAGGNQSVLIDGAMKFTSGVLTAGNSTIEFGNDAQDIMTGSVPENSSSYILGNAKMLSRPVGNNALDMLGAKLGAQTGSSADVGNMSVLRTTYNAGAISPAFPNNGSIRTVWTLTPSNTSSSRSDVAYRYLGTTANLNAQTPISIYAYRYSGGQWNKVSAGLSSTQTGDVYTTASFGVPGFSPWTLSSKSSLDAPDLAPFVTISNPSFTSTITSQPITIQVYNVGTVASNGSGPITVYVVKPSSDFTTLALTSNATGTGSWTITDNGSFYTITSIASPVISGNFGSISITATLHTLPGMPAGVTNIAAIVASSSGGETNNSNNSADAIINVNN